MTRASRRVRPRRRPTTSAAYLERVNLAIDHIQAHLHEPVRLGRLAQIAMLSPYHFHRVFQAIVGQTPAELSKRLRLEKAIGLMAHGKKRTLTEIAFACGFASSSDFSRSFKQRYETSPRAFDVDAWRAAHGQDLRQRGMHERARARLAKLPPRTNPDGFRLRLRELPARTVAYIRVDRPYEGDGVVRAVERLVAWAERRGLAGGQWLGYQWENPEITALEDCCYHVAVELPAARVPGAFAPVGEIGRYRFPPMLVAQVDMDGGLELALRVLEWIYGVWLPRSRYVPDDQPSFEAWVGRPLAHGMERFELAVQVPVRRG